MKQPLSPNQRAMVCGRAKLDQMRGDLLEAMRQMEPAAYFQTIELLKPANGPAKPMAPCQWRIVSIFALFSLQDLYTEAWERREFGNVEDADWAAKISTQPAPASAAPEPPAESTPGQQPPRCPKQVELATKAVCIGPVFLVLAILWLAWIVGKWLITTHIGRTVAWFASMVALYWVMKPWEGGGQ